MVSNRLRRGLALAAAALWALCALPSLPAYAAGEDAGASAGGADGNSAVIVVIPEDLDPAQRQQIIEDVLKAQPSDAADATEPDEDVLETFSEDLHTVVETVEQDLQHLDAVPGILETILEQLSASGAPGDGLIPALIGFLAIFGGAFLGECLLRMLVWRARPATTQDVGASFTARMTSSCGWMLREVVCLAVFLALSAAIFYMFFDSTPETRRIASAYWGAFMTIRVIMVVTRFAVSPFKGAQRLIPLADGDARGVYWRLLILVSFIAIAFHTQGLAIDLGTGLDKLRPYGLTTGLVVVLLEVLFAWQLRRPIAQLILADVPAQTTPGPLRCTIAAQWHIYATIYFVAVYLPRRVPSSIIDRRCGRALRRSPPWR